MKTLSSRIDIQAPLDRIWEVLVDFPSYREWNPFILDVAGWPDEGEKVEVTLQPPGRNQFTYHPRILVYAPMREIRWKGRLVLPGLLDGEHVLSLAPLEKRLVRFTQKEILTGLLVPLAGRSFLEKARQGFEFMNRALKRRSEGTRGRRGRGKEH